MKLDWKAILAIGAVGFVAVYLLKKQAAAALSATGAAINPLSSSNLAYKGTSAVTSAITGNDVPLGVQIYNWLHPNQS